MKLGIFLAGGAITIAFGILCGSYLESHNLTYTIQAGIITFIGMMGRSVTEWLYYRARRLA